MAMQRKGGPSGATYQVFLSFRGPDTRQGFADVLYHALTNAGIHVFRDNEEIRTGEEIGDEILGAISDSRIFVPIFSKGYASSKWCLMELSKMFEHMEEAPPGSGKKILPIFSDVDADDVKLKTHQYVEAMLKHGENYSPQTVQQWKEALHKAGKKRGHKVKDTGHGEFAELFVRDISKKLKVKHKYLTERLVERDDQVKTLLKFLDTEAREVQFVGIHGMGGIGKTTLAKIVFNKLCDHYRWSSFLSDVRESSQQHKGTEQLQKQLLHDVDYRVHEDIKNVDDGIMKIRRLLSRRKVLIVLDDVDHMKQIQSLAGDASWFGEGSRIIITTRNQELLGRGVQAMEAVEMMPEEALRLFSMHAFHKDSPPNDYLSLSNEVVESTGRLPLALEVIGSHLRDKHRKDWAKIIKRLKKVPHKDVQAKLMISYEALDHETRQIFLDIACFFISHEKVYPVYMWKSCEIDAKMELKVLIHMSLVKIIEGKVHRRGAIKEKRLWMHDQLRDLGRELLRVESSKNGIKRNRLWMHKDAFNVLQEQEGKENVEMLRLHCNYDTTKEGCYYYDPTDRHTFTGEEFSGFRKLRYLECREANFTGNWRSLLPELRWLSCSYCSGEFTGLSLKKLVILDLSHSYVSEDWSGWSQIEVGNKLKVLDLSHTKLRKTPNLSRYTSLERLILACCNELIEIDPSIGKLKGLKLLNVSRCDALEGLPEELCSLDRLEIILGSEFYEGLDIFTVDLPIPDSKKAYCCYQINSAPEVKIFNLPESIGNLRSLLTLVLHGTHITKVPESIGRLLKLRCLSLCGCWRFEKLPDSLADIRSLVELRLSRTNIVELPERVGQLVELQILDLGKCENMKMLPHSIGDMKSLVELNISCSRITGLPTTIGMLKRLEILHAWGCRLLAEIPSTIKGCTSLRILNLHECRSMKKLPDSAWELASLETLYLSRTEISELSGTIGNLKELRVIWMEFTRIRKLPTSIGMLKRLEELHAQDCELLAEVPSEIEGCTSLRVLDLKGTAVRRLPAKLPPRLTNLQICNCSRKKEDEERRFNPVKKKEERKKEQPPQGMPYPWTTPAPFWSQPNFVSPALLPPVLPPRPPTNWWWSPTCSFIPQPPFLPRDGQMPLVPGPPSSNPNHGETVPGNRMNLGAQKGLELPYQTGALPIPAMIEMSSREIKRLEAMIREHQQQLFEMREHTNKKLKELKDLIRCISYHLDHEDKRPKAANFNLEGNDVTSGLQEASGNKRKPVGVVSKYHGEPAPNKGKSTRRKRRKLGGKKNLSNI